MCTCKHEQQRLYPCYTKTEAFSELKKLFEDMSTFQWKILKSLTSPLGFTVYSVIFTPFFRPLTNVNYIDNMDVYIIWKRKLTKS